MSFDGVTMSALRSELSSRLTGGRIAKIAQPEKDELVLTIKNQKEQYKLLMSASAALPLIYLTDNSKTSPLTAPNFCMLLRKHISNGRIINISQPGLERIIIFEIEHLDDMGDIKLKKLIIESMGKHSNIIFCDNEDNIIDAIKHIPSHISSIREVLPGRRWFIPQTTKKENLLAMSQGDIASSICTLKIPVSGAIFKSLTGISPFMAEELCFRAKVNPDIPAADLDDKLKWELSNVIFSLAKDIKNENFSPKVYYENNTAYEYAVVEIHQLSDMHEQTFESVSAMLESFYHQKSTQSLMRQKTTDMRKLIATLLERDKRKFQLQEKQLSDTKKRDKYKLYGELLLTYAYQIPEGAKSYEAVNYYSGELVKIPLDDQLTASENSKKYYDKYAKLKRTDIALTEQIKETGDEITHLESIMTSIDMAMCESDLSQIRIELEESGYVRKRNPGGKKNPKTKIISEPYHYISSDGYDIYVGKNNFQNDKLTFKIATGNDWWFHAKKMPGSHVILKNPTGGEPPKRAFEEAGRLAAWYSKGRSAPRVEIDYTLKKNIRRPNGAKPGFVVYYTNYSLLIEPDITMLKEV